MWCQREWKTKALSVTLMVMSASLAGCSDAAAMGKLRKKTATAPAPAVERVDAEAVISAPVLTEDTVGTWEQGYELGHTNGLTNVNRLKQRTIDAEGCSAVGKLERALVAVSRKVKPPVARSEGDVELTRGFFKGYVDAVREAIHETRQGCGALVHDDGALVGSLFGAVICSVSSVDVELVTSIEIGSLYDGWSGGSTETVWSCRTSVNTIVKQCVGEGLSTSTIEVLSEQSCWDLQTSSVAISEESTALSSLSKEEGVSPSSLFSKFSSKPVSRSIASAGVGLVAKLVAGALSETAHADVVVRDHRNYGNGRHRGTVRDHRGNGNGNKRPPRRGAIRTRPAQSNDERETHAAALMAKAIEGLGCERAGDALRRMSNMMLSGVSEAAEYDRLPPPRSGDRRERARHEARGRWKRNLNSPEFWTKVWDRLAESFRECDLTCFDDGTAIGQLSGITYCSASVELGGLDAPGFVAQSPLPVCGNATFTGCQQGYKQAAQTFAGCSTYMMGSFEQIFNESVSQDCSIIEEGL